MTNGGDGLARRDWILIPLISALTALFLLGGGEIAARYAWPIRSEVSCAYRLADGSQRYRPNCVALTKAIDGPWTENRFNDCGYRTAESCKAMAPGQMRVVVFGSSTSRGHAVPYNATFAARASRILSKRCGRLVDFQNLGTEARGMLTLDQRIPEALALHPNAIILLVSPYDLQHMTDPLGDHVRRPHSPPALALENALRTSRLFLVGQHYMYRDPAVQVDAFVRRGVDDTNAYAFNPLTPKWQARTDAISELLKRIVVQTRPKNIPVIFAYVPRRVQVVLETPKFRTRGVDPEVITTRLRTLTSFDGSKFVDTTPPLAAWKNLNSLFYLADGHPTGTGHAVIASALISSLMSMPTFEKACGAPTTSMARKS